jgi:hypothetical protein
MIFLRQHIRHVKAGRTKKPKARQAAKKRQAKPKGKQETKAATA